MTTWTRETVDLTMESAALTVDNIKIDSSNIGHVDDTDLMALANGALTVNGTVTATGNITGTLATAAQTNITSLGTLTALQVDNININGNTLSTTDSNGDMVFDTNGTGNYQFKTDGGSGTVLELICTDSDGTSIHFLNSTTGTTPNTDGWRMGLDATENFIIYNEETNTNSMYISGSSDNVKFFGKSDGSPAQVTIGDSGNNDGLLVIERKDADEFPAIKMFSSDGTASYLFVADNGTLRIHSSRPTANGDGSAV